jgi:hypothetical protein
MPSSNNGRLNAKTVVPLYSREKGINRHLSSKTVMGKLFWEGAKEKRKKLQAGQCKLLKTTMVHFTNVNITFQYRG